MARTLSEPFLIAFHSLRQTINCSFRKQDKHLNAMAIK
jgi:hypothetical protein